MLFRRLFGKPPRRRGLQDELDELDPEMRALMTAVMNDENVKAAVRQARLAIAAALADALDRSGLDDNPRVVDAVRAAVRASMRGTWPDG